MDRTTAFRRALLTLSLLCGLTTVVTVALVTLNVMGWLAAVLFALGFGKGAAEAGGLIMAVFTVGSFASSGPISVCSVLTHVIGFVAAAVASRVGAERSAVGLMVFHAVTFLVGGAVLAWWVLAVVG